MQPLVGLVEPISARLDSREVTVLDLGADGALIEHAFRLTGDERRLTFEFEGERLELVCRVVEAKLQGALSDREQRLVFHTVVEFDGDRAALDRALAQYAVRLTDALQANSEGVSDGTREFIDDVGRALRDRTLGYVSYVLRDGQWRRFETMSPEQPLYGFTVAAHEDEDQLRLLRLAYEEADGEGRKLLRQFAAASIELKKL